MLQLRSILVPADNSGAKKLRLIQIPGSWKRKRAGIGDVVTAVVDQADPNGAVKDSEIVRVVIVRTRKEFGRDDGSWIRFDDNAVVVIDPATGDPKGTRIFGPIAREIKDKGFNKIVSLAEEVL